jgi:hypothetical protein
VSERKSPLERAVDLFVFAPLGFVLEARRLLPDMVELGRQQIQGQLSSARAVGEYAVQQGQARAESVLETAQKQASGTVEALGALAGRTRRSPARARSRPAPAPVSPRSDGAGPSSPRPSSPNADALAIPDYDSLSASQVVPRLAGLSGQELEAVRAYESAHRSRKTILNRVAQLQSS